MCCQEAWHIDEIIQVEQNVSTATVVVCNSLTFKALTLCFEVQAVHRIATLSKDLCHPFEFTWVCGAIVREISGLLLAIECGIGHVFDCHAVMICGTILGN